MTDQEWLTCTDPDQMLFPVPDFRLFQDLKYKRKLRLWIAACMDSVQPPYTPSWAPTATYALWREGLEDKAEIIDPRHLYDYARYWTKVTDYWETPEMLPVRADLIREVFGPKDSVTIPASVLIWDDNCITKIAKVIYQDGAWDRLPIMADAIEDAGCEIASILNHCRGTSRHVKGCWVLDLILGQ